MAKSQARKEYERVYRNAKAKERRLNKVHNVEVKMQLLTPTEWAKAPNKKREIQKLDRFTERGNRQYDYINLGKESIKRSEYQEITADSKRINDQINYHKQKGLKRSLDFEYLVTTDSGKTYVSDQKIEERINANHAESLKWQKDSSREQGTVKQLKAYQKKQRRQLERSKTNFRGKLLKKNYMHKLEDFDRMLGGTSYESEYRKFIKEMKKIKGEDFELFYYISQMGKIHEIEYVADNEIGTPEGQEKIYRNMKKVQSAWESVQTLISS